MSRQSRSRGLARAVLLAMALAATREAGATTVRRFSVEEQVDAAELVFVGKALREEVALSRDGSFPYTYVTFAVKRVLKGEIERSEITLRFDGGTTEREVVEVVGMPTFTPGRRYLLFVSGNGEAACPLFGWGQGKLRFVRDAALGREVIEDERGSRILGLERGDWVRGRPRRSERRSAPTAPAEPEERAGVMPADPDQVEKEAAGPDESASAEFVVESLEQLVRQRAGERSLRAGRRVRSADPRELPEGRGGAAETLPR